MSKLVSYPPPFFLYLFSFCLGIALCPALQYNLPNSHNLWMCYVFLLTALFYFMRCDKWVLCRQTHTHRKQRPERELDYSTIINILFPEPRALDPYFILQTTSSTTAFLRQCPMGTRVPDSLYKLFKLLLVWIDNRKWKNVSSWTRVLKVQPRTSSSNINRELVGNTNPWSQPHIQWMNQKLWGVASTIFTNQINKYPDDFEAWEWLVQTTL